MADHREFRWVLGWMVPIIHDGCHLPGLDGGPTILHPAHVVRDRISHGHGHGQRNDLVAIRHREARRDDQG